MVPPLGQRAGCAYRLFARFASETNGVCQGLHEPSGFALIRRDARFTCGAGAGLGQCSAEMAKVEGSAVKVHERGPEFGVAGTVRDDFASSRSDRLIMWVAGSCSGTAVHDVVSVSTMWDDSPLPGGFCGSGRLLCQVVCGPGRESWQVWVVMRA